MILRKKEIFFVNIRNQLMANADGCAVEMLCKCVRRREKRKESFAANLDFRRVEGVHNCYFPIFDIPQTYTCRSFKSQRHHTKKSNVSMELYACPATSAKRAV